MTTSTPNSSQISKTSNSNFVSSFFFLPPEKRDALQAVYAYCRITDDIVDIAEEKSGAAEASAQIESWRKETVKAFREQPSHPVLAELKTAAVKYKIPEELFHQLIDGVTMDLANKSYPTFEALYPYCYRVAGVVGLMCLEIFEYKNPASKEFAVNLGVAFQLTNILRDIKSDAGRGRVYLPEEDLRKFSITREQILALGNGTGRAPAQFRDLVLFECQRAEHYYRTAKRAMPKEDRSHLIAAEVMCAVYHAILAKIRAQPDRVTLGKVRLSKPEMCLRLLQGWTLNKLHL